MTHQPEVASVRASARKSNGAYKPLVQFPSGRTLVVEQNPERFAGNRYARGNVYANRADAIAAAQEYIAASLADARARYEKHPVRYIANEIALWCGK